MKLRFGFADNSTVFLQLGHRYFFAFMYVPFLLAERLAFIPCRLVYGGFQF
jgi:hypothetical protein